MRKLLQIFFALVLAAVLFYMYLGMSSGTNGDGGLVGNAKIKNIAWSLNSVHVAVQKYRDLYQAIPGDDRNASKRWPDVGDGDGDGRIAGDFNAVNPAHESVLLWLHLIKAGLTDSSYQINANAGIVGVQETAPGAFAVCTSDLTNLTAQGLDTLYDDGNPGKGTLQVYLQGVSHFTATDRFSLDSKVNQFTSDLAGRFFTVCTTQQLVKKT